MSGKDAEKSRTVRVRAVVDIKLPCTTDELNHLLTLEHSEAAWGETVAVLMGLVDPARRKQAVLLDADCEIESWREV